MGVAIFIAALLSVRFAVTVAIFEIFAGIIASNIFSIETNALLNTFADLGALFLIFIAGTEINVSFLIKKSAPILRMGLASFFFPFFSVLVFGLFVMHWELSMALLVATAASTTSVAVSYPILRDGGLLNKEFGKFMLMVAFVPDILTTASLFIFFTAMGWITLITAVLIVVTVIGLRLIGDSVFTVMKEHSSEVKLRFIFLLLVILAFFSEKGGFHPSLAVFILGILISEVIQKQHRTEHNLRALAFSTFIPIFFFKAGLLFSVSAMLENLPFILMLLILAFSTKYAGIRLFGAGYLGEKAHFAATLMNTRLTFGTIASTYGLTHGIITPNMYSVLISMIILASVTALLLIGKLPRSEEEYT